ncbi:MAG: nucleotidyltransferase substrate binding protein [Bacteroidales bacterium]
MNHKEIRWKQRFNNLIKAYRQLENANDRFSELSVLEKEGMIQRFEYTFELSWKTLKDYLESQGLNVQFPRDVIKEAFSAGIIPDGEIWMDMLDNRNLMSHTYQEEIFREVVENMHSKYFPAITKLIDYLEKEL